MFTYGDFTKNIYYYIILCAEVSLLVVYKMIPVSHDLIVEAFNLPNEEMNEAIYKINDFGWAMIVFFSLFNLGYLITMPILIHEGI